MMHVNDDDINADDVVDDNYAEEDDNRPCSRREDEQLSWARLR